MVTATVPPAGHRGQHPDLVTGVREIRQDGRLDLADNLERARAHDGNARTRTGLQVPAPPTDHAAPFTGSGWELANGRKPGFLVPGQGVRAAGQITCR
jgi:hypothetical protein